jgi:hypothetical protein
VFGLVEVRSVKLTIMLVTTGGQRRRLTTGAAG